MDYNRDASQDDLLMAWELNTNKIVSLLEATLLLRLRIQQCVPEKDFSDAILMDSLKGNLKQLNAMGRIRHAV